MGLFDKLLNKKEKVQIPDKPLEEMTNEELRNSFRNTRDRVLEYRHEKEMFRRGMGGVPSALGHVAFWGKLQGEKVDVDLQFAEECARASLRDAYSSERQSNKYQYVLGYISLQRCDLPELTYCFTPDFDALERDMPFIMEIERKKYREHKSGLSAVLFLDEIQNLRRVGYDKVEYTPDNVVSFFRGLAEKGDPTGQYWLAKCYEEEYRKGFEHENCVKWLVKAAEQGYPLAVYECDSNAYKQYSASEKYEQIKKEKNELVQLMEEYIETVVCTYPMETFSSFVAKKNAAFAEVAQKELDIAKANSLYQQGLAFFALGEQDKTYTAMLEAAELGNLSAYEWLVKQSAEEGNALSQYQLGEMYLVGTELSPKNPTMAFPWLAKAASGGVMEAYWRMGELYREGAHGFERNEAMAAAMYQKGAEGKHKPSMLCYGAYCKPEEAKMAYRKLIEVCGNTPEDKVYKLEAYRRLSILDSSDGETSLLAAAQFVLMYFGEMTPLEFYVYGDHIKGTPIELVKAAFAGDADTARNIGFLLDSKDNANIDDREKVASVWWRLAADLYLESAMKGDAEAIKQLFYLYLDHLHDEDKAYYWGMKGLETGDAAMYFYVADNPKLFNLAHEEVIEYLEIAAQKGHEAAKEQLIYWRNQERYEIERQRKVQRILDEREEQRRSQREWELNARLDNLERMSNALAYGGGFTDEERALMGKMSAMDSIRSANLRDEVIKSLMKKE